MKTKLILSGLAVLSLSFGGCFSTSREVINLRDDISDLQMRINELEQNQADLSVKMDMLNAGMGPLTGQLQETQNRMMFLGRRLDDVEANITNKMDKLSEKMSGSALPSVPLPSQLYNTAYTDYSTGKYELARSGFESYVQKYPNSEMAPQAQYYIGECYYALKEYANAIKSFEAVQKNYPKSSAVAAAALKEGMSLELSGKKDAAIAFYKTVTEKYPNTTEANSAKDKLGIKKSDSK